jgi:hypothetical protein
LGLNPIAIEFHFVHPAVAGRHDCGADWPAGLDEAKLGHRSGCTGIALGKQLGFVSG